MGLTHIFALGSLAFTFVIILVIIYGIVTFIRWLFGQNYVTCPCCKGATVVGKEATWNECRICSGTGLLRERHARRWMAQKAKGAI